jgi:mannose-1-phosphate guanylyltransferase/phosphomannomutase
MGPSERGPGSVQVLILAGGKGTRSENPKVPKPLQQIWDGKTILDIQLEALAASGFTKISLLLGHLADQIIDYLDEAAHRNPTLSIGYLLDEQESYGTAQSVSSAVGRLGSSKDYLLLLGDTVMQAPLDHYFLRWKASGADLGVLCHPNLHLHDSDVLLLDSGAKIHDFREKGLEAESATGFLVQAATGVLFFTSKAAKGIVGSRGDVTKGLITHSLVEHTGAGIIASHYFKDSGTAGRLASIRSDFSNGSAILRGARSRAALLLDRDGTLISDGGTSRDSVSENEISYGVAEAIRAFNEAGVPVFVITNQPGIAKGQITESEVLKVHNELGEYLSSHGALIDGLYFCPHHPEVGFEGEVLSLKIPCLCRKPENGMLLALAGDHGIDLKESVFVGDSAADSEAAARSGCRFKFASWNGSTANLTSKVLLETLEEMGHASN